MTAKEYLSQAFKIDNRIRLTLAKKRKMQDCIRYRSPSSDGNGTGGQNVSDKLGETIAKIIDYERKADELIDLLVDKRLEIERTITAIPNDIQREVLERRYLTYQRWKIHSEWRTNKETGKRYRATINGIAEDMGYSERQIFYIHEQALKNIIVPEEKLH